MSHQSFSHHSGHVSDSSIPTLYSSRSLTQPPYSFFKLGQKRTFFSLPLELRQHIYSLILGSDNTREILSRPWPERRHAREKPWSRQPKSALLCTCKLIFEEASDILYKNSFLSLELWDDPRSIASIGLENLRRTRKLELILFWRSATWNSGQLDLDLWGPMLENLTSLTIIADTPRDLKDDSEGAEPLRGWLGPIFQYINEQLAPDVNITIDDDGLPVTESLVEKSFTRRNVGRVETVKGDAYFMRGSMALFA